MSAKNVSKARRGAVGLVPLRAAMHNSILSIGLRTRDMSSNAVLEPVAESILVPGLSWR